MDTIKVPFQEARAIFLILETLVGRLFCKLRSSLPLRFRVPESSICFPWAAEVLFWASRIQNMLPLGCRNAFGQVKY